MTPFYLWDYVTTLRADLKIVIFKKKKKKRIGLKTNWREMSVTGTLLNHQKTLYNLGNWKILFEH